MNDKATGCAATEQPEVKSLALDMIEKWPLSAPAVAREILRLCGEHRVSAGRIGFNEFLGKVQGRLLEDGYEPPAWPDTIRDQGDLEAALDSCVQWCKDRLDESRVSPPAVICEWQPGFDCQDSVCRSERKCQHPKGGPLVSTVATGYGDALATEIEEAFKMDGIESFAIRREQAPRVVEALRSATAVEQPDPGTVKILTALVERAYGIFTASGVLRVAEQDPNSNDPIVAWASDVRSILYRSKPAAIDAALRSLPATDRTRSPDAS